MSAEGQGGSGGDAAIEVRGARTHNLKGVDVSIPHGRVTVVTGPSGAGKSSLAFDTVFAEGQRRFVESMSTYARQFLQQMERPPVDSVDNVLPPVALEAKNSIKNARSTVGTITEVQDVLRLLFTHLGEIRCPGGQPARRYTSEEAVRWLVRQGPEVLGQRYLLVVELPRPARASTSKIRELVRQGFRRYRSAQGEVVKLGDDAGEKATWPAELDPLPLVLGRFRTGKGGMQITAAVEDAYSLGGGRCQVVADGGEADGKVRYFSRSLGCLETGRTFTTPVPALFSFNSPLGACPTCQGFGRVMGVDPERVIPDPSKSLEERPIAAWNTPAYRKLYPALLRACRRAGVDLDTPWEDLPEEVRDWIWHGEPFGSEGLKGKGRGRDFLCLDAWFQRLERKIYRVHVRVLLARYRSYTRCPDCGGSRLKPEALAVRLRGLTLPEISAWSIERFREWLAKTRWTRRQRELAGHLLEQLEERVEVLDRVGLGYLSLDRQARTLSGGETQRIHLGAALGSGLTSTLYVLDEPTIGLHPSDSDRLLALLHDLAERGNTVLVVEHDRTLIEGADHVIDLGPRAGEHGGEKMAQGPPEEVLAAEGSLTAEYFAKPLAEILEGSPEARAHAERFRREHAGKARGVSREKHLTALPQVEILGARAHNLKNLDVAFPRRALVAVTGVSGSGKSTLVANVLYGTYQRARGVVDVEPGECDELRGLDDLEDVTLVDQSPLGRSSRSNPVTYVKAYDEIRKIYAATPEARARGITAGHFSFNTDKGRCPECQGTGVTEVDMQFMAAVTVTCDRCEGRRFKDEVLAVRVGGRTIAETLELTVDEAARELGQSRRLVRRLEILSQVGLGYLRLGQPTSTLSGGEAQRLKLASFLDRPKSEKPRLFLFDEPTTGLHLADIDLLMKTLRRLVQRGDSVVVVEHSPDLIARADWIVDLGPGGGVHGGELLYSGPRSGFLDTPSSPTAKELARHLRS